MGQLLAACVLGHKIHDEDGPAKPAANGAVTLRGDLRCVRCGADRGEIVAWSRGSGLTVTELGEYVLIELTA